MDKDATFFSDNFDVYRRQLPHWRADTVIYFVTWRLHKGNVPLSPEERTVVARTIEHFHASRYWLLAFVVMDDHVHVLVRLGGDETLQKTVHTWKSYSANQLQRNFGRVGAVWQDESLDRIVRDADELDVKRQYIAHNPVKRWPDLQEYEWVRQFEG